MFAINREPARKEYIMKEKAVFKRWIAVELRLLGYKIIRVEPNRLRPQYDVYIFEDDGHLGEIMNRLCQNRVRSKGEN